jgi:outer membrane receptor protein involved in Fe transport
VFAIALSTGAQSLAQAAQPVAGDPGADQAARRQTASVEAPADDTIPDIIVTAQKRSERLSDVPISITTATGEQLIRNGITDAAGLEKITPDFVYTEGAYGTPVFTIRGIGYYDTQIAASPTVSVYLDQVSLPFPAMTSGVSLDLERVEVLKGPQGTLFGQNSTGGAINYIAAKPTEEFHSGFYVDYGRFNATDVEGFVSGKIAPDLTIRVAGRYDYRDPWQEEYLANDARFGATGNEQLGRVNFGTTRVLIDWHPTSSLDFELNINGWRDESDTQAAQFVAFAPQVPLNPFNAVTYTALSGLQPTPDDARLAGWTSGFKYLKDESYYQIALRAEWRINDVAQLNSITSYEHYSKNDTVDLDGTAYKDVGVNPLANINSFSGELRLSGNSGPIKWLVGGNYARDNSEENQVTVLGGTNDGAGPFRYDGVRNISDQAVQTWAGFGSLEYAVTNQLSLSASARYTKQNRNFAGCLADSGNGQLATAFGNIFGTPTSPGGCVTMASPTAPVLLPIVGESLDQDNVSWRGNIDYKVTADTLLYANVTKGYKAGSFPALPAVYATQLTPATQESVLAYESGFKTTFFERRLELDGAVFYYDYSDKQILGTVDIVPFGNLPKLVNIPKSRVIGAEWQATARPIAGLSVTAGVTYVDSRVEKDPPNATDPFGLSTSFVGEAFPFTPKWEAVADAEYKIPIIGEKMAFIGGNVRTRSSAYTAFGSSPVLEIGGYSVLDLRGGVEARDGRWRAELYGRNVTNRFYETNVVHLIDTVSRTAGLPVTYGISFSRQF